MQNSLNKISEILDSMYAPLYESAKSKTICRKKVDFLFECICQLRIEAAKILFTEIDKNNKNAENIKNQISSFINLDMDNLRDSIIRFIRNPNICEKCLNDGENMEYDEMCEFSHVAGLITGNIGFRLSYIDELIDEQ